MYTDKVVVAPSAMNDFKPNNISKPHFNSSTNHYQRQLNLESHRQHSLNEAMQLASQVNMKHDANGCYKCDVVAGYYMTALKCAREVEPIQCSGDLLDLTWQMTNLILSHRETNKYQYLYWFDLITAELWEFAKQLKEESFECDLHISTTTAITTAAAAAVGKRGSVSSVHSDNTTSSESESEEENYRRAIRITIYNCRALVYEQSTNEVSQAIAYYRKCASVRPTPFEPQQHLQQTALAAMQRLIESSRPPFKHKNTFSSAFTFDSVSASSSSSSASSSTSSSTVSCSFCGVEKLVMPVCARCKTQPYCSVRCVKAHKLTHQSICS